MTVIYLIATLPQITLSDCIAAAALFLSACTMYYSIFRPAKTICPRPRLVVLINRPYSDGQSRLGVATSLLLTNTGAKTDFIDYFYARVIASGVDCELFCKAETPFKVYIEPQFMPSQDNMQKPFALIPGGAVCKNIVFEADQDVDLAAGSVTVEFYAKLINKQRKVLLATRTVELKGKLLPGRYSEAVAFKNFDVIEIHNSES